MANETWGQFKANAIREQLDGAYGETYAYAKLNRKHNEVCQLYCSLIEDVLEALDVMGGIENMYIWSAFRCNLRKTEELLNIYNKIVWRDFICKAE